MKKHSCFYEYYVRRKYFRQNAYAIKLNESAGKFELLIKLFLGGTKHIVYTVMQLELRWEVKVDFRSK